MSSIADGAVIIQTSPETVPSTPSWFGEVAAFAQVLTHEGILKAIAEQVRFARARFGQDDLIDFVAVLIGYILSEEPTLLAFYERLAPFAEPFMALFGRNRLPHRSTLSRFLAVLDQASVEALQSLFHKDLLARQPFSSPGGLCDRTGGQWSVIDVDGTRQATRQRALPQMDNLPAPHRRFDQVCAPGYTGRKRGEVVRTRTVVRSVTYSSVTRHVWRSRQRGLSGGITTSDRGDYQLRNAPGACSHLHACEIGWLVR
jgi:hypothetical protein